MDSPAPIGRKKAGERGFESLLVMRLLWSVILALGIQSVAADPMGSVGKPSSRSTSDAAADAGGPGPRPDQGSGFVFFQDSFAFINQLSSDYELDPVKGRMIEHPRTPRPAYTLHCFVVSRAARQFFEHARFEPGEPKATDACYRYLIRRVVARNPRKRSPEAERIVIPGYRDLREFSAAHEALLKAECGQAYQSFIQRGNWRMVFPFSRRSQERTAQRLNRVLEASRPPIVHVVCFPELTVNHVLLLFGREERDGQTHYRAYDPNRADGPTELIYDRQCRSFYFPPQPYWAGGRVNAYEIYRGLFY